jgi:acyl transferase domain-containing protein/NAD(P)H-dependent flavin oxidoreductase YrpB (nitropropane dioxygenase family)/NAD(P)-dependent dehydrogenase (short-subunit alcohol dehydrogenase family)
MAARTALNFGVCLSDESLSGLALPEQVAVVMLPWGMTPPQQAANPAYEVIWQVSTVPEACEALETNPSSIILKGCEGAGACSADSAFLLFQALRERCLEAGVSIYIQGGIGIHTAAAYLALGASGVVMDSQLALFAECGTSPELKAALGRLSGNEIRELDGFRYFVRPGGAEPPQDAGVTGLKEHMAQATQDCMPLGQDVILGAELVRRYGSLKRLVRAIGRAPLGYLRLAQSLGCLAPGDELASDLGTELPLAQGPMARISDVPQFLRSVADEGALPYLAMSMTTGSRAAESLAAVKDALDGKAWGVGILGFIYPKVLEEQTRLIIEAHPPVVLIAGGRPSQARAFEQAGIQVFLHVPTASLLDMFLKEGARSFVFEGRESGGHVGPLPSAVLWDKQVSRLLEIDDISSLKLFFAGGVHDALSAAFVRVLASQLVARGAKVGLQVGTAYLYTDEAVSTGAITEGYRKQLVEGTATLLLKSGAGQESRCIPSAFTDYFEQERQRMLDEGLEMTDVLMRLEELNLGRLRIASKGVERQGDALVQLDAREQGDKGLFMTGAVTPLINETGTIPALHDALFASSAQLLGALGASGDAGDAAATTGGRGLAHIGDGASGSSPHTLPACDVAIVGMECIFPDAANKDEYWRNILLGRNSIREVSPDRWQAELFYDPEASDTDHVVSKWGGFIDASDFDALEFGITPQSLAAIEPVQLLSLLVAKRALADAGYTDLSAIDMEDTSVIFGGQGAGELTVSYTTRSEMRRFFGALPPEAAAVLPRLTEDSFPGVLSNLISGRITNRLNMGGRNYTVDAACASSLAALDIAYTELACGKADMVVLGGADAHNGIGDFLMFGSTYALSRTGRCSTFDAEADGIALGEGVGVVILKRLDDARRDGNKIYAVIKGIGGSSDGKVLGLTAPDKQGQQRAMERAYAAAGVDPAQIGLIEAHGTGTVVGDRAELEALNELFLDFGTQPGRIRVGSVKTQIGHTKCAAGVAGLIKTALSVQHGLLPRTLNLKHPNGAWLPNGPFSFRTESVGYWNDPVRLAGVSGFGFGGTNFHVIVGNHEEARPAVPLKSWPAELLVFRGATPEEACEPMRKIVELFAVNDSICLKDIAFTLASQAGSAPIQFSIVATSRDGLLASIEAALAGAPDEHTFARRPIEGKVAFLFPGQGSQRTHMAAGLFTLFPRMRRLLDAHPEYLCLLFPDAVFTDEARRAQQLAVTDTRNAQPLLGIVDLALATLLRDLGVQADMAAGHSYGELVALCFAGAFEESCLVSLSAQRAEAVLGAVGDDPGRMAAVRTDTDTLEALLDGAADVWAVNYNAPKQTVVAGTGPGLDAFLAKLDAEKVSYAELDVACAFHSPLLAGAQDSFAAVLKDVAFKKPSVPVWSNTTAEAYPTTAPAIRARLAEQLVSPVRFAREIESMYDDGARVFIEAGPGATLTTLAGRTIKDKGIACIQTERADKECLEFLLTGLAHYLATGREISMDKLYEGRDAQEVNIDKPEAHKKNATVWKVDGGRAVPEFGELPAHAGTPVTRPLLSLSALASSAGNHNVEDVVMAFLDNVNNIMQDQRDVMLGYLGSPETAPRSAPVQRTFVFADDGSPLQGTSDASGGPVPVEATVIESAAPGAPAAGSGLPDIRDLSTEQITEIVLSIISDKTGYPTDMLGLDVNLEADLSIDSIKKVEIVGGLRDRVNLPEEGEDMDDFFEKMIAIKTIRSLVEWIQEMGAAIGDEEAGQTALEGVVEASSAEGEGSTQASPAVTAVTAAATAAAAGGGAAADSAVIDDVVRMILTKTSVPLGETDESVLEGKRIAVTDDGKGLAAGVVAALGDKGAEAVLVTLADLGPDGLAPFDGLVLVSSAAGTHYTAADLFGLLKTADMTRLRWAAVFDDLPAELLRARKSFKLERLEGFSGLIKSLCHEYPGVRLSMVEFDVAMDAATLPAIVVSELCATSPFPEVFYEGAKRFALLPHVADLPDGEPHDLGLDSSSLVLVLGGAQGITPHLVGGLAKTYPCRYLLVGSTAPATPEEEQAYAQLAGRDEIRRHLIDVEGMKQPREIEQKTARIAKTKQIAATLLAFEALGATASYHSVDVTETAALRSFVRAVVAEHGTIDGVVHAAGILEDKRFCDMAQDSFERVYRTKTAPLAVIAEELLGGLKLLVMFSSMSSALGNAGQCNYAAGNSVFDITARILSKKQPELRVMAFNWGPWKGTGMVNDTLEAEFRKRGISLLTLEKGIPFFCDELEKGTQPSVLAIAGQKEEVGRFIESSLQ